MVVISGRLLFSGPVCSSHRNKGKRCVFKGCRIAKTAVVFLSPNSLFAVCSNVLGKFISAVLSEKPCRVRLDLDKTIFGLIMGWNPMVRARPDPIFWYFLKEKTTVFKLVYMFIWISVLWNKCVFCLHFECIYRLQIT